MILDAEGKPTTKLATIADGDKITTGKEDNLRADNIIAILKTSKEYKDARDKMNGMLNTYKKTLESAGITVNTNASITRESSKINFTPNDKVKMDAVAGKE